MTAPDLTPNHPAVDAAERAATRWMEDRELETDLDGTAYMLTAALPHLTAEDLPTRLVRDIQVRTIRATARAVTYDEDGTPQSHDWDRAAVSAWLNELADNIEEEADA